MPRVRRRRLPLVAAAAAALLTALLLAACRGGGATTPPGPPGPAGNTPPATAVPTAPAIAQPPATPAPIALEPAFGGRRFTRPVELGPYPGGLVFVADLDGLVLLLDRDGATRGTLLDLRGTVLRSGDEEGLLSVALDPDFGRNGFLYAYYSAGSPRRSVLARFPVSGDVADRARELVILEQLQPFANHNGGAIRFGPDGMLYLGFGDGGSQGDPQGNGQNPATMLGSIIRIDVRGASAARPYALPPDNPPLPQPGARAEVWAYGFRNPWRMAFDPATGALWVADVGQTAVEEIDIVRAGGNYGWNRLEGDDCYSPRSGCDPSGTVRPVASYRHSEGCSVSGGWVYRGAQVAAIRSAYLYSDYCSGRVWALPVDLHVGPVVVAESKQRVSGFGIDADGELYLLVFNAPALKLVSLR
ncbi:MAG: glucose sorbosone dehydrogenase [Dehalococcoidia bacterium]|nr:glucose sorbosone dehydrogenase [Dehalococcoidia bacterium]